MSIYARSGRVGLVGLSGFVLLVPLLAGPSTGETQDGNRGASAHVIPLFTPAGDVQQGFARIINHSHGSGTVRITGTDDAGRSRGPVTLSLNARETRHFNSDDLEKGNASKGLSGGLDDGQGNWRLRLESDLDLEVGAYIRTVDGFLSSVHDVVGRTEVGGEAVYHVPIFNPGSNRNQVSSLRLANLTRGRVNVTIRGRDDVGRAGPGGEVELTLPAGGARQVSAQALESGGTGLSGRLGDGEGKWQLFVSADGDVEVVSLMSTPTGHLTNLSVSGLPDTGTSEPESPPAVGSTFRDCTACPEMVVVPAGSYLMGSPANDPFRGPDEGPARRVTIGEPFAVGVHEVTFAQWDACHRAGGCSHRADDQGWGRGTRPVVDVSWNDAQEYVRWLSGETGRAYRLPSEAEWEYAARAGTTTLFWWGDDLGQNHANCDRCGSPWDDRQTAPVGSFAANAFGLHDVHGNVWERVQDCRNDNYVGAPRDGSAWESGNCNARGVRGGGWRSIPLVMRTANRAWVWPPSSRVFDAETGFRVARALAEPARHTLALFRPAGQTQQGFARIINRSNRAGTVRITGTDDSGDRRGPISLRLEAGATRHFNSDDLEGGNAAKGLSGAFGDGEGDWRLELVSDLDIEPSAYIRTPDGFLTAMHAVARSAEVGGETVHQVPIFNPGSNRNQVSWLRVANLTGASVNVTIRGRDDEGRAARSGEVRLALPAHGARRISAQQLESGAAGLSGRFGAGTGKWQLFVTADGAVEVVSLLQSPTGHLSNLSTTPRGGVAASGFKIVAEGSTTVRPLQTISLSVPGGLGRSEYTVLMDLSETGAFAEDHTIEVEGLTTDRDRILTASPMRQALAKKNPGGGLALRIRREADGARSNVLHFTIEDITIPAQLAGFPTLLLDTVLKSIYTAADDALLNTEAAFIQPGLAPQSARTLGLDVSVDDVQAEAVLQALLGISVTTLLVDAGLAPEASEAAGTRFQTAIRTERGSKSRNSDRLLKACELATIPVGIQTKVCTGIVNVWNCEWIDDLASDSSCLRRSFSHMSGQDWKDVVPLPSPMGWVKAKTVPRVRQYILSKLPGRSRKAAITALSHSNSVKTQVERYSKLTRASDDPREAQHGDRHSTVDASGRRTLTKRGLRVFYDNLRALNDALTKDRSSRISTAQRDYGNQNLGDAEKEAFWAIVNESDRQQRDAEAIEDLEGVYLGEEEPLDAIRNNPGRDVEVATTCKPGYEEFPIDDDTSTCVFESLVEPNCYAGSRRVHQPDLGDADVCLYYSLDFFLPNGQCRQNYAEVYFEGRRTCRWAELKPHELAWYTLRKEEGDEGIHFGLSCVTYRYETEEHEGCRRRYNTEYQLLYMTNNCPYDVRHYVLFSGSTRTTSFDLSPGPYPLPIHGCHRPIVSKSCTIKPLDLDEREEICGNVWLW